MNGDVAKYFETLLLLMSSMKMNKINWTLTLVLSISQKTIYKALSDRLKEYLQH